MQATITPLQQKILDHALRDLEKEDYADRFRTKSVPDSRSDGMADIRTVSRGTDAMLASTDPVEM